MEETINNRVQNLINKGVKIIDPRQTYISDEVNPDRIFEGSILFPGTRLTGARTLVGSFSKIGPEGPAVINDSIIGSYAEVASGFISESTLLPKAKAGANSHFRAGTLLEEEASTAHSVGLKQSILMYGVTMGSLINFCDVLITGGRSRSEHTEVGSGFIHFNFTPWGKKGDKATPSLVGNVIDGVFLDQERIFLGGLSGMVGPNTIGFGAMTVAGQVIREPVADSTMHSEASRQMDKIWSPYDTKFSGKHLENIRKRNIEFITQLYALHEWYLQIRLNRSNLQKNAELSLILTGAMETIRECIRERVCRYNSFAAEWSQPSIGEGFLSILNKDSIKMEFSLDWKPAINYDEWIWKLAESEKEGLQKWLNDSVKWLRTAL